MRTYYEATVWHCTDQKITIREHRTLVSMEADFIPNATKSREPPMALKCQEEILPEIQEVTLKWVINNRGGHIGETWWRGRGVLLG